MSVVKNSLGIRTLNSLATFAAVCFISVLFRAVFAVHGLKVWGGVTIAIAFVSAVVVFVRGKCRSCYAGEAMPKTKRQKVLIALIFIASVVILGYLHKELAEFLHMVQMFCDGRCLSGGAR